MEYKVSNQKHNLKSLNTKTTTWLRTVRSATSTVSGHTISGLC